MSICPESKSDRIKRLSEVEQEKREEQRKLLDTQIARIGWIYRNLYDLKPEDVKLSGDGMRIVGASLCDLEDVRRQLEDLKYQLGIPIA